MNETKQKQTPRHRELVGTGGHREAGQANRVRD